MLRALKAYAAENGIECWLSLEEKMACGIGACLACVCKSKEVDSHSHVHNKRICKDGPVFAAEEVELHEYQVEILPVWTEKSGRMSIRNLRKRREVQ